MTAALALAGCTLGHRGAAGDTRVGQGKVYQSDNPTYDEFFDGVHEVQAQTTDALDREAKARGPLEHALGTRNTMPERLVDLTKDRVKKGRDGSPLHVVVTGLDVEKDAKEAKKVVAKVTVPDEAAVPAGQRDLVKALDESAQSEAEVATHFGPVALKARRLLARQGQLAQSVNRDFSTASRRDEVSRELRATKPILDAAADRAERASNQARSFLKGVASAFPATSDAAPASRDDKPASGKSPGKPKREATTAPPPKPNKPVPVPAAKVKPTAPPHHETTLPAPTNEAPAPRPEPIPTPAKPPPEDFNP
jgi:hypothetical protein